MIEIIEQVIGSVFLLGATTLLCIIVGGAFGYVKGWKAAQKDFDKKYNHN